MARGKTPTLADLTVGDLRKLAVYGGREDTPIPEALEQIEAARERGIQHQAESAELQRQIKAWHEGRATAANEAACAARGRRTSPQAAAEAREAAHKATIKFQRTVPRPRTPGGEPAIPEAALLSEEVAS